VKLYVCKLTSPGAVWDL